MPSPRRSRFPKVPVFARLTSLGMVALVTLVARADEPRQTSGTISNRPQPAPAHWPQWRGPLGTGTAPNATPPIEWSEEKNVRWKIALPGKGHSTPVSSGEHLFLTTAVPRQAVEPIPDRSKGGHDNLPITHWQEFVVLAVARSDGGVAWQTTVHQALPHEGGHYSATYASPSPVTDGELLFASFGSNGLYCLDLNGELLWKASLGRLQTLHGHGEGSSPTLHGETIVVNWDHEGESFVVAFNKHNGDELWRQARDEVTSWASPIVVEHEGRPQLVVSGTGRVRGYDLATGEGIWECGGLSRNVVATPVAADGVVYAASSYDTQAMFAIRLDGARGDITGTRQVLWSRRRSTPYVPSPLLYGDSIYFLRHYQGILTRVEKASGREPHKAVRLPGIGNIYASPVAAADRIYVSDRHGATIVLSHDTPPKVLALNHLDEGVSASAVLVQNDLFLRGHHYLYCLAESKAAPPP